MHKLIALVLVALTFGACQEKLEEKAAREAETFTLKNCPLTIDENVVMDSMTFHAATLTLAYHYRLGGPLLRPDLDKSSMRQSLLDALRNTTALKAYKEKGFNFSYIYHAETKPDSIVFQAKFSKKDYGE